MPLVRPSCEGSKVLGGPVIARAAYRVPVILQPEEADTVNTGDHQSSLMKQLASGTANGQPRGCLVKLSHSSYSQATEGLGSLSFLYGEGRGDRGCNFRPPESADNLQRASQP